MQARCFPVQGKNGLTLLRLSQTFGQLIATRQIPNQRLVAKPFKHRPIPPAHLFSGQNAAQWVINVRVGTRLVQNQVAVLAAADGFLQPGFKPASLRILCVVKMLAKRVVLNPVDAALRDDVVRAVTVMGSNQ